MTGKEVANYLDVNKDQVLNLRETDHDTVIFVIDYGIAGSKKFEIPLSDIWPPVPASTIEEETVAEDEEVEQDLSLFTVVELKELAKTAGVEGYANMRKAELVEALGND